MRTASRDEGKEAFWRRIIREQPRRGCSIRAWCERHRVRESSFYWWRRELERRDAQGPPFAPVRVADASAAAGLLDLAALNGPRSHIEIVLPTEHCVRVVGAVDRQVLTDVLAVLRDEEAAQLTPNAKRVRNAASRKLRPC